MSAGLYESLGTAVSWFWRTRTGQMTGMCIVVAGTVTALGDAVDAWPKVRPYAPALIYQVEDRVAEYKTTITPQVNELLRWKLEELVNKQDEQTNSLKAESTQIQTKLPTVDDVQTRIIFEKRLEDIKKEQQRVIDTRSKLEYRLKRLGGSDLP